MESKRKGSMNINKNELTDITPNDLLARLEFTAPPYNPFEIAKRLGIHIDQTLSFENIGLSGSISRKDGEAYHPSVSLFVQIII